MNKINVLQMIYNMEDGGAQKIVLNYTEDFKNDNQINNKVLIYGEKTDSYYNKLIESRGYKVDYLFENFHNTFIRKFFRKIFGKYILYRYLKKNKPDIVHVHISAFLSICLKPIKKSKIPICFDTLHSNPLRYIGNELSVIREAFQNEKFIPICVTKEQAVVAKNYYGFDNFEVVHNGVDIKSIREKIISKQEAREIFNLKKNDFVVVAVGRLEKIKRYDILIKSFAKVCHEKSNSRLLIAGRGTEKETLINLVNELNIGDKVFFLGNLENVIPLYCAADVMAITSDSESSSLVLLEAQICKLKCVISNGVPSESVVNENIIKLNKNATTDEWAFSILHDENFIKKEHIIDEYDVHSISTKMKNVYLKYWRKYINEKE